MDVNEDSSLTPGIKTSSSAGYVTSGSFKEALCMCAISTKMLFAGPYALYIEWQ